MARGSQTPSLDARVRDVEDYIMRYLLAILPIAVIVLLAGCDGSTTPTTGSLDVAPIPLDLQLERVILGDSTAVALLGTRVQFWADYDDNALYVTSFDQSWNAGLNSIISSHDPDLSPTGASQDTTLCADLTEYIDDTIFQHQRTWGQIKMMGWCMAHPQDPRCSKPQ
jgi:hypothetical protein